MHGSAGRRDHRFMGLPFVARGFPADYKRKSIIAPQRRVKACNQRIFRDSAGLPAPGWPHPARGPWIPTTDRFDSPRWGRYPARMIAKADDEEPGGAADRPEAPAESPETGPGTGPDTDIGSERQRALQSLLEPLNPNQRRAVAHGDGPLMVFAGAGSGKTRVITHRIARLLLTGVPADGILAITFTNKAAAEMRERATALCGVRSPWIATFHSFSARLLRRHMHRLQPFDNNFSIYDAEDSLAVLRSILVEQKIDSEIWTAKNARAEISRLKNRSSENDEELEANFGAGYALGQVLRSIFHAYNERLAQQNAVDFDDLLLFAVRLLREHEDLRERYGRQFEHILVDEYQDTNGLQYTLLSLLCATHQNICVTGDPDQSIYAWRGAEVENIARFERDYNSPEFVVLDQNYRSVQNVLDVANALIANNRDRHEKNLWSARGPGEVVRVRSFEDARTEANAVAARIEELIGGGATAQDIAILYRINSLSRVFEEALIHRGLPYRIVGGIAFFQRLEVKDILAYLQVLANPRDDEAFKRIVNVPRRGIGSATLEKLVEFASREQIPLVEAIAHTGNVGLGNTAAARVRALADLFQSLQSAASEAPGVEALVLETIQATDYESHVRKTEPESALERLENLEELRRAAKEFDVAPEDEPESQPATHDDETDSGPISTGQLRATHADRVAHDSADEARAGGEAPTDAGPPAAAAHRLRAFLERIRLLSSVDEWKDGTRDRVTLLTLHAAKGLEFPHVFIVGVEEGLLPLVRMQSADLDLEEERRLLYVGITRSMETLTLTHVRWRERFGRSTRSAPSTFLAEIVQGNDESVITCESSGVPTTSSTHRRWNERWESSDASSDGWAGLGPDDSTEADDGFQPHEDAYDGIDVDEDPYPPGCRVYHDDYGEGEIVAAHGQGSRRRITIVFDDEAVGRKQFVTSYVSLRRV